MKPFFYRGKVPSSKSVLIRQLLVQSYNSRIETEGFSSAEDVRSMSQALAALKSGAFEIPCGEAGLVLRLMMGRVSREPGEYLLKGAARLLDRPHDPMIKILEQLGVRVRKQENGIYIATQGWRAPAYAIEVSRNLSSQFATSLLLNSWDLDFPIQVKWGVVEGAQAVSTGYFDLSLSLARELGMSLLIQENGFEIAPHQPVRSRSLSAEMDYSSAFAVAGLAAIAGRAVILNADPNSQQPDAAFEEILKRMGASVRRSGLELTVTGPARLSPVRENLSQSPDLFPVLGVLCAFADGESELGGAPHLIHKESNRIELTARLIESCGRKVVRTAEGLKISGTSPQNLGTQRPFTFEPAHDHRMVMAAAVALWAGVPVRVLGIEALNKSFPEFAAIAGLDKLDTLDMEEA